MTGSFSFFVQKCRYKDVILLDTVTRLVQAGIRPDCAAETVAWFRQQGNDSALERYIQEAESRHKRCVCAV